MFGAEGAPKIAKAREQVPKLENDPAAREEFVNALRSLLDPSAASEEDNSKLFFKMNGAEMLEKLKVQTPLVVAGSGGGGGGASLSNFGNPPGAGGGAAGLGDLFSGVKSGAMRLLNYLTYYEMKNRAGTVGKNGVGPMIDRLAGKVERVHLVGHSFGGRVVAAAAAGSTTDKLQSLSLLQTAFSHNGFSKTMNGFFRSVVDQHRVKGPILVTYTPNDRAVGLAYPTRLATQRHGSFRFRRQERQVRRARPQRRAADAARRSGRWDQGITRGKWQIRLAGGEIPQPRKQQVHRRSEGR